MEKTTVPVYVKSQRVSEEKIGRIARVNGESFVIWDEQKSYVSQVSGKFRYESNEWPIIGDWVVHEPHSNDQAIIHKVLNRKTVLYRKEPGTLHQKQMIAANIDSVFIVTALTNDFNLQRLERYVLQAYESGAKPIIICTKSDLVENTAEYRAEIENYIPAVPVYVISSFDGNGMEDFMSELKSGETYALIGSSGVGKSTLINQLLGQDVLLTNQVREQDGKGRHTTTHREMFLLPNGSFVMDTPGMREIQVWGESESLDLSFSDIDQLAGNCKFRDCEHNEEPGCAVQGAISNGSMTIARLKSYHKLTRELERLELKEKYGAHRTNRLLHSPNSKKF
ncbi:ribosome small subunit-dependent GTPase A [Halobacillus sp. A1]|uniref:ribosome small subunit-dependent GTPase A n=1 Tax=Halobacillus sp. A1 TaxID=2880262 RepID=UPI0020A6CA2E|nr:ribosome small subunit-dependent GTPase A [Halobacillus sp. A1]MCP3030603.1 ribosome small subunit-dependent GTPase A [Halobacillus sp. A1]